LRQVTKEKERPYILVFENDEVVTNKDYLINTSKYPPPGTINVFFYGTITTPNTAS
jgi:hypothetical protein